jgi:acetyltransferase-like isoleucine patch superfamily enzyme
MRNFLNKVIDKFNKWLKSALVYTADSTATVSISKKDTLCSGNITVGKNSVLKIEEGVKFSGKLVIGDNCNVHIGKNCFFRNITIKVLENSELTISGECIFDADFYPNNIWIGMNSKMFLQEHVRIQGDILVRFGGVLTIGTYSSINWGSEIRCEEKVTIGEYCLMSYEVSIYDTNTHSTDWKERRQTIPNRATEEKRPSTKPVIIGDDVWIGKGATILKGATIGNRSIIGIRTVVPSGNYAEESRIVAPKPVVLNK